MHGTVQGVFFRASCEREARTRGVAGWVTNQPDDAVEAVFEGEVAAVEAMVNWVHHGPPRATVDRVEVSDEEPEGLRTFDVR